MVSDLLFCNSCMYYIYYELFLNTSPQLVLHICKKKNFCVIVKLSDILKFRHYNIAFFVQSKGYKDSQVWYIAVTKLKQIG